MNRVVIIGGGNLAEAVAVAIAKSTKAELVQIYLRNRERGEELSKVTGAPYATFDERLAEADIYLLAVSDSAIGELSHSLNFTPGAVVAHTAGSTSIEAINPELRRAVFYPMQTFTRGRRVDFSVIPIFIEAEDAETLLQLETLGIALSRSVIKLDSEQRRRLHLSAVFVCNFANAMFIAGEQLVGESGLPFEILKPLIGECCAKALDVDSPKDVQTGPAVRGDWTTVERHTSMLDEQEELKIIYQNISKYIWETSKKI
ncbi:MAG: Rossmann-like and DUF2520 domain-containing protein [Rikenellaceae bacterium]